ncbi:MAG: acetolactate decarboxylase [Armatimonadota bacterium]
MRKSICCIIIVFVVSLNIISSGCTKTPASKDTIYQISTIDALMTGLYDGTESIKQLKKQGDTGIGTFDQLDGEMVVLDGKMYKITGDGKAHVVSNDEKTPFAAITYFEKDIVKPVSDEISLNELHALIDDILPSKNLFYAIRIDGTFSLVKTRSVPRQSKPYAKLVKVVATQPVFTFNNIKGSVIGFRCPYYVKSVNVPGYHLHFIDDERTKGGHVLDLRIKDVRIYLDTTPQFKLNLPESQDFLQANIDPNTSVDLEKVEKSKD